MEEDVVVNVPVVDMVEAIRFMRKTPVERVRIARSFLGQQSPPSWLDDMVFAALRETGMIEYVPMQPDTTETGEMIAVNAEGEKRMAVVTAKGVEFARTGVLPTACGASCE